VGRGGGPAVNWGVPRGGKGNRVDPFLGRKKGTNHRDRKGVEEPSIKEKRFGEKGD